ncbi:MAG: thiolase family protein [Gaiellales bacterium]
MAHEAVIAGVAHTRLGELPELTDMGINIEAATAAVADAGLTIKDIDGVLVQPPFWASPRYHILVTEALGIYTKTLTEATSMGGASYGALLQLAKWAIEDGQATNVLVVAGEKLRTAHVSGSAMMASVGAHNLDWEYPFCATIPSYYALLAQRYLHEYGLDDDAFAPIAVTTRKHACLNPEATMRTPITEREVLDSPMISSPLRRLDCSLVSDGGAAWVISRKGTSGDSAREVSILGVGEAFSYYHMGHLARGDGKGHGIVRTVVDVAGKRAFERARITPADLDLAMIYDSFTVTVTVQLEDLGLCGRGESRDFVREGNMDLGGRLPLNTHGGLLSCAHPGACGGMLHFVEAVRQLRGEATGRQVEGCARAVVTSASAVASNFSVSVLGAPGS